MINVRCMHKLCRLRSSAVNTERTTVPLQNRRVAILSNHSESFARPMVLRVLSVDLFEICISYLFPHVFCSASFSASLSWPPDLGRMWCVSGIAHIQFVGMLISLKKHLRESMKNQVFNEKYTATWHEKKHFGVNRHGCQMKNRAVCFRFRLLLRRSTHDSRSARLFQRQSSARA